VIFDDNATAAGPISVDIDEAGVAPFTTTFNNTKDYVLTSSGGFGISSGSLTKSGAGTVTISTVNTYAGPTAINAGAIVVSGSGTLGTGSALTLGGGRLDLGGTSQAVGALSVTAAAASGETISNGSLTGTSYAVNNETGTVVISANLLGTGAFTKSGAGEATLSGVNTYTGTTTVSAGVLNLTGNRTVNTATIFVGSEGTAAELNISNGNFGITSRMSVGVGASSAGNGTVNHTDGTLTFTEAGDQLLVGTGIGSGTYNLSGGSVITLAKTNRGVILGVNNGSSGTFNLSGTGELSVATRLQIGRSDYAGVNNTTNLFSQTGGTASVGTLSIGGNGTTGTGVNSTMTLTGGIFAATTFDRLAAGNTNTATITIGGTADVTLPAFPTTRGTGSSATVYFNGGTLRPYAASTAYMGGLTAAYIKAGGATFDVAGGKDITVTQSLLTDAVSTGGGLTKLGAGAMTVGGTNTYTGATTVGAGTLVLDYSANNTGKLSDTAALGLGGNLVLNGGSHTEIVASTSLIAGTVSSVTRASGSTAVLQMGDMTRGAGAVIDFGGEGIATTNTTNVNGILFGATINGADWATNSTNGPNGLITAYTGYTDVTRLDGGAQVIGDGSASNVRIVEGTGSPASITLGAATTTIFTLNQSAVGGASAATIDPAGQTLLTNAVLVGTGAGGLTIGTGTNNGTLAAAAPGGELALAAASANGLTINSVIADNSGSSLNVYSGTVTLAGANTYAGATTITGGALSIAAGNNIGDGSATNGLVLNGGTLRITGTALTEMSDLTNSGTRPITFTAGKTVGLDIADAGNTFTVDKVLDQATGGLTKLGAGTAVLDQANTYTGVTTVGAGTLQIGGGGAGGSLSTGSAITVASGAILAVNQSDTVTQGTDFSGAPISGAGGFAQAGSGTTILNAANTYTGGTTVSAGTLQAWITQTTNALGTGAVSVGTGSMLILDDQSVTNVANVPLISNVFTGNGLLKLQFAAGTTARNTYMPNVTGFGGTIQLSNLGTTGDKWNAANLGTIAGSLIVDSGNTIYVNSGTTSFTGGITLNGAGNSEGRGAIRISGATTVVGGDISLASSSTISMENVAAQLTGNISSGAAGTQTLTLGGTGSAGGILSGIIGGGAGTVNLATAVGGTYTLTNANTYTGGTTISGSGLITANNNSALGTGEVIFNGGTRLVVGSGVTIANAITIGANVGVAGRGLVEAGTTAGTATVSGPITINSGASAGGLFAAPTAGTILHVAGAITSSVQVTSRIGTVMFSGGGTGYADFSVQQGTVMVGADNGIATTATVTIGASGASVFDLNGLNQSLVGVTKGANAAVIGNSSTTKDSTLTITGASTFAGIIQDAVGSGTRKVNLTVNGGALTLTGANTYTGDTTVSAGTLSISTAYLADAADVFLTTGAVFDLAFTGTDTIDQLFVNGIGQLSGTWGAAGSGANHVSGFFTGTGLLNVTTSGVLPGDTNEDRVVDAADFITLKKNFGTSTGAGVAAGDFNTSDTVDWADLGILMNNFGAGGGAPATAPEPCSAMLLVLGAAAVIRRRARIGRVGQ
jgi:autotransporter-associated beta strand protein